MDPLSFLVKGPQVYVVIEPHRMKICSKTRSFTYAFNGILSISSQSDLTSQPACCLLLIGNTLKMETKPDTRSVAAWN